jgi:hypothetical protein
MSNTPITSLPAAISLTGAEVIPAVQSNTTVRVTAQQIANLAATNGTVTKIIADSPLSGGTITTTGTIGLQSSSVTNNYLAPMSPYTFKGNGTSGTVVPQDLTVSQTLAALGIGNITNNTLLGNISGGTGNPTAFTLSDYIDAAISNTQGSILYRSGIRWTALAPSTSGQVLSTNGAGANPSWISVSGTGTVTSVATGTGLSGGPITGSGTISIANTAVTAGSYGSASTVPAYQVNAQGQLTSASNVNIAIDVSAITSGILPIARGGTNNASTPINGQLLIGNGTGYALNTISPGAGISIANGAGTISVGITNTSVSSGSYGSASSVSTFTVNSQGQLTAASSVPINGIALTTGTITTAPSGVNDIVNKAYVDSAIPTYSAGTGLTLVGTTFSITNTAVTAISYGSSTAIPTFTVNAQGQLTAASTAAVIAPAGTLSGTTLNSTVVSSSLTSVGTIGTGVWQGTTVATGYGGTGLTTFTSGGAVYATSTSALTTGTLPITAGGTGITAFGTGVQTALGQNVTGSGGIVLATSPTITTPTTSGNVTATGTAARFLADFTNATVNSRFAFQTSTTNSSTGVYALPNGSSTAASWQAANAADPTNASKILIATNGSTDVQLVSGVNGSGTYLPLTFYNNGSEQMRLAVNGNFGIGTNNPAVKLAISSTDSILVPVGTTAQRPTGATGYFRFNTDLLSFEGYNGTSWGSVGGGATGGGTDAIFWNNGQTVTTNYSIPSGQNSGTFGPVTVNSSVVVTIPAGSTWSIV